MRHLTITLTFYATLSCVGCAAPWSDTSFGEPCEGVTALAWERGAQGTDAETALRVAFELAGAAEVDAAQVEELGAASASLDLDSELSRAVKKNVHVGQEVEDEFWQQSVNFTHAACFAAMLLERDDLTPDQVERALLTVDRILNAGIRFENGVKKNQGS